MILILLQKIESLSTAHVDYGVEIPMLQSFGTILIQQVKESNIKHYNQPNQSDDSPDGHAEFVKCKQIDSEK